MGSPTTYLPCTPRYSMMPATRWSSNCVTAARARQQPGR